MLDTAVAQNLLAGNRLLDGLHKSAARAIQPHLQEVNLHQHQTLYDIGERVRDVYFPVGAVLTGVLLMNDGTMVETCLVGSEGVAGINAAFGRYRSNYWMKVLLPGRALRITDESLRAILNRERDMFGLLLLYYRLRINHVSLRAVCNSRHRIFERLCTWLLMLRDRAGTDDLPLTQEIVARQLGVRRAGINECVAQLQRVGAVEHKRGVIRIRNRRALEESACTCRRAFHAEMKWFDAPPQGNLVEHY